VTDEVDRRLRRQLAEEDIWLDDAEFVGRVARRVATTRQRPTWADVDWAFRTIVLPVVLAIAAALLAPTVATVFAPALQAVNTSAAGAVLPLAIAAGATVYTWLRA